MLKANVGLSRKLTRDYNSTGYSVNIDGEIGTGTDDHQAVLGRIKELFSLAEEALAVEMDRDQGEQNIGARDEEPMPNGAARSNGTPAPEPKTAAAPRGNGAPNNTSAGPDAVTSKQVQFVFNLAKRHRLSNAQLEAQIEQIVGRRARVYDLTKREAGRLIDALTQDDQTASAGAGARK